MMCSYLGWLQKFSDKGTDPSDRRGLNYGEQGTITIQNSERRVLHLLIGGYHVPIEGHTPSPPLEPPLQISSIVLRLLVRKKHFGLNQNPIAPYIVNCSIFVGIFCEEALTVSC